MTGVYQKMPYRSDLEALEARHAMLSVEVAARIRERDEAAAMLAHARARVAAGDVMLDRMRGGPARRLLWSFVLALAIPAAVVVMIVGTTWRLGDRPHRHRDDTLAQFRLLTDQMCACTEQQCAQRVSDRVAQWATTLAQRRGPAEKSPQLGELSTRMARCMTAAMTASSSHATRATAATRVDF